MNEWKEPVQKWDQGVFFAEGLERRVPEIDDVSWTGRTATLSGSDEHRNGANDINEALLRTRLRSGTGCLGPVEIPGERWEPASLAPF